MGGRQAGDSRPNFEARVQELKQAGNWNVLVLYASEWTRKEPTNPSAWHELSVGYAKMRQLDDAFQAAAKAVALAPQDARLWNNLGHVNLSLERLPEAKVAFDHALALLADDPDTLCSAALVAQRQGRASDADALAGQVKGADGGCRASAARPSRTDPAGSFRSSGLPKILPGRLRRPEPGARFAQRPFLRASCPESGATAQAEARPGANGGRGGGLLRAGPGKSEHGLDDSFSLLSNLRLGRSNRVTTAHAIVACSAGADDGCRRIAWGQAHATTTTMRRYCHLKGRTSMTVKVEKKGFVWTVIHDRPEARNAMDPESADALTRAFLEFDADDTARVAVLYGEGGAFCAGWDLKYVSTLDESYPLGELDIPVAGPRGNGGEIARGPLGPSRLELDKPVIAAVAGPAVAGGMELALWCDFRVMQEDAYFGVYCRRWGVPLIDGGTVRLPKIVGQGRALEIILTGRKVPAEECLRIGLCEYLVPNGTVRAKAEELAQDIASFPPTCVRVDRRSAIKSQGLPVRDALIQEWYNGREALVKDGAAGAMRFKNGLGRHGDFTKIY